MTAYKFVGFPAPIDLFNKLRKNRLKARLLDIRARVERNEPLTKRQFKLISSTERDLTATRAKEQDILDMLAGIKTVAGGSPAP